VPADVQISGDVVLEARIFMAFASKVQDLAFALRATLTIFDITLSRIEDNKINNSYNNNKLIIIYV